MRKDFSLWHETGREKDDGTDKEDQEDRRCYGCGGKMPCTFMSCSYSPVEADEPLSEEGTDEGSLTDEEFAFAPTSPSYDEVPPDYSPTSPSYDPSY